MLLQPKIETCAKGAALQSTSENVLAFAKIVKSYPVYQIFEALVPRIRESHGRHPAHAHMGESVREIFKQPKNISLALL